MQAHQGEKQKSTLRAKMLTVLVYLIYQHFFLLHVQRAAYCGPTRLSYFAAPMKILDFGTNGKISSTKYQKFLPSQSTQIIDHLLIFHIKNPLQVRMLLLEIASYSRFLDLIIHIKKWSQKFLQSLKKREFYPRYFSITSADYSF